MKVKIEYSSVAKTTVVGPDLHGEEDWVRHEHLATILYQALNALEGTPAELPDRVSVHHVIAWLTAIHLYNVEGNAATRKLECDDLNNDISTYLDDMTNPRDE